MDGGTEPSAEFGKFVVASIFQAIKEFAGIKGTSRDHVIQRVKRWNILIIHLDYFKTIHNLAQSYLVNTCYELFGGNGGKRRLTDATSAKVVQNVWNTSYTNDFKRRIDDFKIETKTFLNALGKIGGGSEPITELGADFYVIQKNVDKIESHSENAYVAMQKFVVEIEEVAEKALSGNDILNIGIWRRPLDGNATDAACSADEAILNLIPVLSFLYGRTITCD